MASEIGLFEAMYTARAIRRFKPDPVPQALILQVIEAGTMAPSAANGQPWIFVVVRDDETKRFVQERYARTFHAAYGRSRTQIDTAPSGNRARLMSSAVHLAPSSPSLPYCCFAVSSATASAGPAASTSRATIRSSRRYRTSCSLAAGSAWGPRSPRSP